jgi:hypothetical protein
LGHRAPSWDLGLLSLRPLPQVGEKPPILPVSANDTMMCLCCGPTNCDSSGLDSLSADDPHHTYLFHHTVSQPFNLRSQEKNITCTMIPRMHAAPASHNFTSVRRNVGCFSDSLHSITISDSRAEITVCYKSTMTRSVRYWR